MLRKMKTFLITDGDLYITPFGVPVYLDGHDKLNQDVEKILLTAKDQHDTQRSDPEYGCDLPNLIGSAQATPTRTKLEVVNAIKEALSKLKEIQEEQYSSMSNKLLYPRRERLESVAGMQVIISDTDPRRVQWKINLVTKEDAEVVNVGTAFKG